MIGNLLGKAIRVVTLPVDAANIGMDLICGGSGSKKSRMDDNPIALLEELRDKVAETAEKIDN
jgi:hypothetical protein